MSERFEVQLMTFNIKKAVKHSSFHRVELLTSRACGCFHCLKIFSPEHIEQWADQGKTAICPYCGMSSVIGDASNLPINNDFLLSMQQAVRV